MTIVSSTCIGCGWYSSCQRFCENQKGKTLTDEFFKVTVKASASRCQDYLTEEECKRHMRIDVPTGMTNYAWQMYSEDDWLKGNRARSVLDSLFPDGATAFLFSIVNRQRVITHMSNSKYTLHTDCRSIVLTDRDGYQKPMLWDQIGSGLFAPYELVHIAVVINPTPSDFTHGFELPYIQYCRHEYESGK